MQKTWVDVTLKPGEPLHITPYSDVHWDSRDCNRDAWLKHYKRRAALPHSHFLSIGDFNNLVMARDVKRHVPSAPAPGYAEVDDYIGKCLDDSEKAVRSQPTAVWDLWGMGNHEYAVLKFHSFDVCKEMAKRLNTTYGTYSGRVFYRIKRPGGGNDCVVFQLLYHHGAWGGQIIKGLGGAQRWSQKMGSWNVMCYGHNHQEHAHKSAMWDVSQKGKDVVYDQYIVNTGAWVKSMGREGEAPDYSEIAGHPIVSMGTPLIRVWFTREFGQKGGMELHYSVEA